MRSPTARGAMVAACFAMLSSLLGGASCTKTSKGDPAPEPAPVAPAAAGQPAPAAPPAATTAAATTPPAKAKQEALPGVDLADLPAEAKEQFFRLTDSAPSPCGKAQSLRAALKDPTCKRAPFAGKYLKKLAAFGAEDAEVLDFYKKRYQQDATFKFDLARAPYEGQPTAKVKIVEFFDYGCPACKTASPMIEDLVVAYPGQVVVYYMHFPLRAHPQSPSVAAAAIAAQRQNKFRQMHRKLFEIQGAHGDDDIRKVARAVGLDMKRFEADWKSPETKALVDADQKQGNDAKLEGTPQLYVNGRMYSDPVEIDWVKSWIDEELAVNQ
jgi:protein-disulfide isomerase